MGERTFEPGRDDAAAVAEEPTGPGSDLRARATARRAIQRKVATGAGVAVDPQLRTRFEAATGAGLDDVRVHTGDDSQAAAKSMSARAYTVGSDVHFGAGQYNPGTPDGDRLIAHELTHTVQQRGAHGAGAPQHKREVSQPGDAAELEADDVAASVVDGRRAPAIAQASDTVARKEDDGAEAAAPEGRKEQTEFGEFLVMPDEASIRAEAGEISESDLASRQRLWAVLKSNGGDLKIGEVDSKGKSHGGFKVLVLSKLGMLLERPKGAELLGSVVNGGQAVTIQPASVIIKGGTAAQRGAGANENADGSPGPGGTTTIVLDETLKDSDLKVLGPDGNEIDEPVFIALGHELIHATHNQKGVNQRNTPASEAKYPNMEEEETIKGGGSGVGEADLRKEHHLPKRSGHGGRDSRGP